MNVANLHHFVGLAVEDISGVAGAGDLDLCLVPQGPDLAAETGIVAAGRLQQPGHLVDTLGCVRLGLGRLHNGEIIRPVPEFRAYPLPDLGKNLLRLIGKRFGNLPGNRRSPPILISTARPGKSLPLRWHPPS